MDKITKDELSKYKSEIFKDRRYFFGLYIFFIKEIFWENHKINLDKKCYRYE